MDGSCSTLAQALPPGFAVGGLDDAGVHQAVTAIDIEGHLHSVMPVIAKLADDSYRIAAFARVPQIGCTSR